MSIKLRTDLCIIFSNSGLDACNCHSNATCENIKGSIKCMCKEGFLGDGQNSCEGESNENGTKPSHELETPLESGFHPSPLGSIETHFHYAKLYDSILNLYMHIL